MSEKVSKKNINIWEAKIVILFTFFFEIVIFLTFYGTSLQFIHGAVNGREIVTIIIILKVDHYVFFSSFFLHLISEEETRLGKYHVIRCLFILLYLVVRLSPLSSSQKLIITSSFLVYFNQTNIGNLCLVSIV